MEHQFPKLCHIFVLELEPKTRNKVLESFQANKTFSESIILTYSTGYNGYVQYSKLKITSKYGYTPIMSKTLTLTPSFSDFDESCSNNEAFGKEHNWSPSCLSQSELNIKV